MNKLIMAALALTASTAALAQAGGSTATDAQATPVTSAPATAPADANQMDTVPAGATVTVNPNQAAVPAPTPVGGDVPTCSKTITDRCIQIHQGRGGGKMMHRGHGRKHHPMRHHRK